MTLSLTWEHLPITHLLPNREFLVPRPTVAVAVAEGELPSVTRHRPLRPQSRSPEQVSRFLRNPVTVLWKGRCEDSRISGRRNFAGS